MACLNRAACDFNNGVFVDAKTIAEAIAPQFAFVKSVSAMEARGVSPGVSYGMKKQTVTLVTVTAVLTKRQGRRVNCRR